jgi:hypothetical protein
MPDIPAKAVLDLGKGILYIDGQEFPWEMTATGPVLANLAQPDGLCTVTLTFYVDAIEVLPVPEKSGAQMQAEMRVINAQSRLDEATASGDPVSVEAAQLDLIEARSRLSDAV